MNLVEVLEIVPMLLHMCDLSSYDVVRLMRLVNKEASRVALLALNTYSLCLQGDSTDTNVSGSSLLRQADLHFLDVHLTLSGSYSPTILLQAFIQEVGPALKAVTSMTLLVEDTGGSTITAALLDSALARLVSSCPALTSLYLRGKRALSSVLTPSIGISCPLLKSLAITDVENVQFLQASLRLLPTILPRVTCLELPCHTYALPDMSHNTNILSLDIGYIKSLGADSDWNSLPPKLQYLRCGGIETPPPANAEGIFNNLLHLDIFNHHSHLHIITELPQIAPNLQKYACCSRYGGSENFIECTLDLSSAAEMTLLQSMQQDYVKNAIFFIHCRGSNLSSQVHHWVSDSSFMASLPRMTNVGQCAFCDCKLGHLGNLLAVFPKMHYLTLKSCKALDDVELQVLAGSVQLERLKLMFCDQVSPMGLFALCQLLPNLKVVKCVECVQLQAAALHVCAQLLGRNISIEEAGEEDD